MKIIYAVAICLCSLSAYSQTTAGATPEEAADGYYLFRKATATIYNDNTKAEVLTRTFSDTASLKGLYEIPSLPQPVFLWTYIYKGKLTSCKLWNNGKEYFVQEEGHLLVPAKSYDNVPTGESEFDRFSQPFALSPVYQLNIAGNTATFTFTEHFGCGLYSFPLLWKFEITLVKYPSNESKNDEKID